MNIDIITLLPNFWINIIKTLPIINKALLKNNLKINIVNLRNYGIKKGNKVYVDDYQYGGGYGMVLKLEPIYNCINTLKKNNNYNNIIYLTPDSTLYNQNIAKKLSKTNHILFLSGYFKGIDQRIRDNLITNEYSIGKYIISNGDLSTLIVIDSIIRLLPGILGNIKSTYSDSFNKYYYDHPLYTRPYKYKNMKVPKILLSGNHNKILKWRNNKILKKIYKYKDTK
ncbi:MAG: tRNA (guanosine(37)-N1)-methyltransferase TrmD [Candidatus Shikimatogenerans bostrichidophilus]|nr:MAG: tRNA (guanosine(37)-N1)-methyltransferase TrmD [Candidatus Shikimatogenerans bostrichidophilus]